MRATTSAVYLAREGRTATMDAARRIAALTHGGRAAWEGMAVYHELIRLALNDHDPIAALPPEPLRRWLPWEERSVAMGDKLGDNRSGQHWTEVDVSGALSQVNICASAGRSCF